MKLSDLLSKTAPVAPRGWTTNPSGSGLGFHLINSSGDQIHVFPIPGNRNEIRVGFMSADGRKSNLYVWDADQDLVPMVTDAFKAWKKNPKGLMDYKAFGARARANESKSPAKRILSLIESAQ